MFLQSCPCKAFLSRLVLLNVRCNKRLMSTPRQLAGTGSGSQLTADSGAAEPGEEGQRRRRDGDRPTEEELHIHRLHREACEVRPGTSRHQLKQSLSTVKKEIHQGWTAQLHLYPDTVLDTPPSGLQYYCCISTVISEKNKNSMSLKSSTASIVIYSLWREAPGDPHNNIAYKLGAI